MTLIFQAVLVMLATVVSNLVESTNLPPVPEDSNHTAKLEGSEPLPLPPENYELEPTAILPHERAYFQVRTVTRYVTKTERHCATTVTPTVNYSPTLVPELPELPGDYCNGPGQFLFGATNECFLYLSDGLRSFADADAECRKGGMQLAKPKKPKAIQKHLVNVLGHSGHVWLGARGDGHSFKWQTNDGASIRNTDPNWWHGLPVYHVTNEYCLALVAYPNAVKQEKVFYPESCSLKRTALCQREECSPQCTMGTCTGPNTCVYDPRSEAICPDGCGNGQCTAPNKCTCSAGYEGITCDKSVCPDGCGNGQCTGPNKCRCSDGYEGDTCDKPRCLGPWVHVGESCYLFVQSGKIWTNARTNCEDNGGDLAIINTESKRIALLDYLRSSSRDEEWYLGGSNLSGDWLFVDNSTAGMAEGWNVKHNEPNHGSNVCMYTKLSYIGPGKYDPLFDRSCDEEYYSICEK